MRSELESAIAEACQAVFGVETKVQLTRPKEQFGDYASNVALQLAGKLNRQPPEIAKELAAKLRAAVGDKLSEITVAGSGFLNLRLSDQALIKLAKPSATPSRKGQKIVAEYSDPNPFKVLHAGHLYTSIVGDAIANILEYAGAEVHRVNFGGDVGLHVAKTIWAIIDAESAHTMDEATAAEAVEARQSKPLFDRARWIAECYVEGHKAYSEDENAKQQIVALNKRVYQIHEQTDESSPFARIYWLCRQWSYDYFKAFYQTIKIKEFERYYPESETAPLGLVTVKEQLVKGVFVESDGAIVFNGEKYGLHTRVFVTSQGLPTYEAKDVGLIMTKWRDYHFDESIVITANDIVEYMKVVLKSVEQFAPKLAERTTHLTHGNVKLSGGVKMSSRLGNILYAEDVLSAARLAYQELYGSSNEATELGAVKYAFLKQRLGSDIIYDPKESVSLEGNSGPYLQYAHARARSILAKNRSSSEASLSSLESDERSLLRKISEYTEVIELATHELMPHHVCNYLYELAQVFNRFYERNRVIGSNRQTERLILVADYANVLEAGLGLLGIAAPHKM
jgi:arginyl-tRNA synthetase